MIRVLGALVMRQIHRLLLGYPLGKFGLMIKTSDAEFKVTFSPHAVKCKSSTKYVKIVLFKILSGEEFSVPLVLVGEN